MDSSKYRVIARQKKKTRVRRKIFGTAERPRLAVFRSAKHIYVQVIDDVKGATIVASSTLDKEIVQKINGHSGNKEAAILVGADIAAKTKNKGITRVVFDRGGYIYHGRVKSLADAAREAGLEI